MNDDSLLITAKRYLNQYYLFSVIIFFAGMTLFFSVPIRMAEIEYNHYINRQHDGFLTDVSSLTNYTNTIWNIIITITTLGYGDVFVKSVLG